MPLLDIARSNPTAVRAMAIEQIVKMAGDGKLRDHSDAQLELRGYLQETSLMNRPGFLGGSNP